MDLKIKDFLKLQSLQMLNNAKIKKSLQGKFQLPGKHDLKIIMRCDYKIRIKKPPKYIRQCFQEPFIQTKEPLGS